MDRILLTGVRLDVHLGVPLQERAVPQTVIADIECGCDASAAGLSDDFSQTIDYAAVLDAICLAASRRSFSLVEALAESLAAAVLDQFNVASVRVLIRKPSALAAQNVEWAGVEIHRNRQRD